MFLHEPFESPCAARDLRGFATPKDGGKYKRNSGRYATGKNSLAICGTVPTAMELAHNKTKTLHSGMHEEEGRRRL
jgi:hypothetical protein